MLSPEQIAEWIVGAWMFIGGWLFFYSWLGIPVMVLFLAHRIDQLGDRDFEMRATTPTHTGLLYFYCAMHGLILPAFYFLSVRTRHELAAWRLGADTNTPWTLAVGAVCMAWMGAHVAEAVLRGGRPQFPATWLNRCMGALALGLCLWFHVKTWGQGLAESSSPPRASFSSWFYAYAFPQTCFLASTLAYLMALCETWIPGRAPAVPRAWRWAIPLSVGAVALLFLPFWLSIPKTPHREAVRLIEQHRDLIEETAAEAELDPKLLAGIIYVAHTRDRPRWTGDAIERLGVEIFEKSFNASVISSSQLLNPSAGLMQMRPSTTGQTIMLLDWHIGLDDEGAKKANAKARYRSRSISSLSMIQQDFDPELSMKLVDEIGEPFNYYNPQFSELLLTPRTSLVLAAVMLRLFSEQWRQAGHPIDDRPEILATLYNIGYERSNPHGAPRANDFGRRVKAFMQSEACREIFDAEKAARP